MKYLFIFLLSLGIGLMCLIFAAKSQPVQSPLVQITQDGIQPEGTPVILKDGETRESYEKSLAKNTMPKSQPKKTNVPLGAVATETVTSTATIPTEAPKQPQVTSTPPTVVIMPVAQPAPVQSQIVTVTSTKPMTTLEVLITIVDANTIKVLTNEEIIADQTTFTGGITLTSSMKFQDGAQRTWKNTKEPAYLYELSTSPLEKRVPFDITMTTGTESITKQAELE